MKLGATFLGALALVTMVTIAAERDSFWIDRSGQRVPDTESRRSKDGFGGWLLVTSDQDWQEKWHTPRETTPEFKEVAKLKSGDTAFVLIFFGNPRLGQGKVADVTCDIRVTRPDQTTSMAERDVTCFRGTIETDPMSVFLSAPVIKFVAEPTDLPGKWVVDVTLHDNLREVEVSLRTSFELAP